MTVNNMGTHGKQEGRGADSIIGQYKSSVILLIHRSSLTRNKPVSLSLEHCNITLHQHPPPTMAILLLVGGPYHFWLFVCGADSAPAGRMHCMCTSQSQLKALHSLSLLIHSAAVHPPSSTHTLTQNTSPSVAACLRRPARCTACAPAS